MIIKIIAGIIIITNSIPPNKKTESEKDKVIEIKFEIKLTRTNLKLLKIPQNKLQSNELIKTKIKTSSLQLSSYKSDFC